MYINYNKIIIYFYAAPTGGIKEIEINIYELAHKCKVWAYEQHFEIHSASNSLYGDKPIAYIQDTALCEIELPSIFKTNTEPESIFEACKWVLKQRKMYD